MAAITKPSRMPESDNTTIDSQLVKNCWLKIKSTSGADAFIDSFYQKLMEHHPEVYSLFPADLSSQKRKLLNTLNDVINGIEYIEELRDELIKLGELHKNLNVEEKMFEPVIATIVTTANSATNFTLTTEELSAWENAFRMISNIMKEAF